MVAGLSRGLRMRLLPCNERRRTVECPEDDSTRRPFSRGGLIPAAPSSARDSLRSLARRRTASFTDDVTRSPKEIFLFYSMPQVFTFMNAIRNFLRAVREDSSHHGAWHVLAPASRPALDRRSGMSSNWVGRRRGPCCFADWTRVFGLCPSARLTTWDDERSSEMIRSGRPDSRLFGGYRDDPTIDRARFSNPGRPF